MGVNFYIGGARVGKTTRMRETITQLANENPDDSFIVIVPEQFTLETQYDYVCASPNKGIMNIDILSFNRLAYRVFEALCFELPPLLDEMGKAMILEKVCLSIKDKLEFFGANINKQGFVNEIKSLVCEFYQYNIFDEEIEDMQRIAKGNKLLEKKLADIKLIYKAFRDFTFGKFALGEEIYEVLARQIVESNYLAGKTICMDGFTGFTPSQYTLIKILLKQAKDFYFAITIDQAFVNKQLANHELFYLSQSTLNYMRKLCAKLSLEENIIEVKPYFDAGSKEIRFIEQNIFRNPLESFTDETSDIRIIAATNLLYEVRNTALEITRLVRNCNYRYNEIAVITGALGDYQDIIFEEFTKSNIPCFIDRKKDAKNNPLIEFIRALFDILIEDYSFESMFRLLKSGLISMPSEDIESLENYCLALGIKGKKRWNSEWKNKAKSKKIPDKEIVNKIKNAFMDKFNSSMKDILITKQGNTVNEYMQYIKNALVVFNIQDNLKSIANSIGNDSDSYSKALSMEYEQIYEDVLSVIDEIVMILGEERLKASEVLAILEAGFENIKLGLIPAGMDQVVVGDIERSRLDDIKVLFFLGVNDGIIPKNSQTGAVLSEFERQLFVDNDIELAPTKRQNTYISEYYLYLALTKPKDKLYISFFSIDGEGRSAVKSYLIDTIMALFPKLRIEFNDIKNSKKDIVDIMGTDNGLTYFLVKLKENTPNIDEIAKSLYKYLLDKTTVEINNILDVILRFNKDDKLSRIIAKRLYGEVLTGSVTRLEKFASCAFAHFLDYGIGIEEREEYKLQTVDIGKLFHKAMESYCKLIKDNELTWKTINEDDSAKFIAESIEKAISEVKNGIFDYSEKEKYYITKLNRIVKRTVDTIKEQIIKGDFEPELFEYQFLLERTNLMLKGTIDRVDICTKGDIDYVRIVDYKSGEKKFDYSLFYHGLQIQLLVYLAAIKDMAKREGKDIKVAGLLYYHMYDPIVNKSEKVQSEIFKKLRMQGLINPSKDIISLMDNSMVVNNEFLPSASSDVIPVSTNKDGQIKASSSLVTKEQFDLLLNHLEKSISINEEKIMDGCVEINPYVSSKKNACEYCDYKQVCNVLGEESKKTRFLKQFNDEEIYEQIIAEDKYAN